MKKNFHPARLFSILFLYVSILPGQLVHIDSLKTLWEFDKWCNKTRDNRQYLITALNITNLLPGTFQCSNTVKTGNEIEVTCSFFQQTQKTNEISFIISMYPSILEAREQMMQHLVHSTAPIEYLKMIHSRQSVTYGDVSFGRDFWGIGNLVFRISRQTSDSSYIENVFQRIDNALMAIPQPTDKLPAAIEFSLTHPVEKKWNVSLHDSTGKRTVIVSSRDSISIANDFSQIEVFDTDDQENSINIIVIEDTVHSFNKEIILNTGSIIHWRSRSENSTGSDKTFLIRSNSFLTWRPMPGKLQFQLFDFSGRLFRVWECKGGQGYTSLVSQNLNFSGPAILQIEMKNGADTWKKSRIVSLTGINGF